MDAALATDCGTLMGKPKSRDIPIKKGSKADNGAVSDPDHIVSMKVAADVEE